VKAVAVLSMPWCEFRRRCQVVQSGVKRWNILAVKRWISFAVNRWYIHGRKLTPVAPNVLNRQFEADVPNRKWLADITYIPTDQGWLYLAVVLDLFSRRVVGWSMAGTMHGSLVRNALQMALAIREPEVGLLHHSDRGSQYAGCTYQSLMDDHQIVVSMSRTGNCYDNAPMESFFSTLKCELVHDRHYHTRAEARQDIFEYIEVFYNRIRLHSSLGYLSPVEYEQLRQVCLS
jgi:putative transposase